MPITPFLRYETFDPETIESVSGAFLQACKALGLSDRADPITEVVARHIIHAAQRGIRTKTALYLSAMAEFKSVFQEVRPDRPEESGAVKGPATSEGRDRQRREAT